MSRIFWDTNVFVYLFQNHPDFSEAVAQHLSRLRAVGDELVTSALTLGEIQVRAREDGDRLQANAQAAAVERSASLVPFDKAAVDAFVLYREKRVKAADAIQLACAAAAGCTFFVTYDRALLSARVPGIPLFIMTPENVPI